MRFISIVLGLLLSCSALGVDELSNDKKLFAVLKMDKLLEQKAINYKDQLEILLAESDLSAEDITETSIQYSRIIDEVITFLSSEEVLTAFQQSYNETFTNEELQDLIDFYSSSTGKKFLAQSGNLNKAFMEKIAPKFNAILGKLQEVEH